MNTIIWMWDIASRQNDIIVRACVICLDPNKCRLWISLCTILQNVDRDQIYIMCNYNLKDTMVIFYTRIHSWYRLEYDREPTIMLIPWCLKTNMSFNTWKNAQNVCQEKNLIVIQIICTFHHHDLLF